MINEDYLVLAVLITAIGIITIVIFKNITKKDKKVNLFALLITAPLLLLLIFLLVSTISTVEERKIKIDNNNNIYAAGYHVFYPLANYRTVSLSGQFDYSENIIIQYELTPEEFATLNGDIKEDLKKETIIESTQYKDLYIIRIVKTPQGINPTHLKIVAEINPPFFMQKNKRHSSFI